MVRKLTLTFHLHGFRPWSIPVKSIEEAQRVLVVHTQRNLALSKYGPGEDHGIIKRCGKVTHVLCDGKLTEL